MKMAQDYMGDLMGADMTPSFDMGDEPPLPDIPVDPALGTNGPLDGPMPGDDPLESVAADLSTPPPVSESGARLVQATYEDGTVWNAPDPVSDLEFSDGPPMPDLAY